MYYFDKHFGQFLARLLSMWPSISSFMYCFCLVAIFVSFVKKYVKAYKASTVFIRFYGQAEHCPPCVLAVV